jgi:hypothetical protein
MTVALSAFASLGTPNHGTALSRHGYQLHHRGLVYRFHDCDRHWVRLDWL